MCVRVRTCMLVVSPVLLETCSGVSVLFTKGDCFMEEESDVVSTKKKKRGRKKKKEKDASQEDDGKLIKASAEALAMLCVRCAR